MKKLIIICWGLILLSACSGMVEIEFPYDSLPDYLITEDDGYLAEFPFLNEFKIYPFNNVIESVYLAVEKWNEALGMDLFEIVDNIDDATIQIFPYENFEKPTILGKAIFDTDNICLIAIRKDKLLNWSVIAHELGHCLGLAHEENEHSLMHHKSDGQDFTDSMIEHFYKRFENSIVL